MIHCFLTMIHPVVDYTLKKNSQVQQVVLSRNVLVAIFQCFFYVIFLSCASRCAKFNFQFPNYRYLPAIFYLRLIGRGYTISLWGSDYQKVFGWRKRVLQYIAAGADAISIASDIGARKFSEAYGLPKERMIVAGYMLPVLDALSSHLVAPDFILQKIAVGERIRVQCGTNGSENQQFSLILDAIASLPRWMQQQCTFVFHMSYGLTPLTYRTIRETLESIGVEFEIVQDFYTGSELVHFRSSIDILIQIQKTDQLSAAMLEHLVQGKPVITGEWLPYQDLTDVLKVSLYQVRRSSISADISRALEHLLRTPFYEGQKNARAVIERYGEKSSGESWKMFFNAGGD